MSSPEFVALADTLRARPNPVPAPLDAAGDQSAADVKCATDERERDDSRGAICNDEPNHAQLAAAVREARLFRARLSDAFDAALPRLLRELAGGVLARELLLAPCDLAAIARGVKELLPAVRVRVAPEDGACASELPVVVDTALRPGDAIVEISDGEVDARLGVRLALALERAT